MLKYVCVVSEPFSQNTYVVFDEGSETCVVIDPGMDPIATREAIDQTRRQPEAILVTHGHADHIAGIAPMVDRWPSIDLVIGAGDAPMLTDPQLNLSAPFGFSLICPLANRLVQGGDQLHYGGLQLEVRDTPGHSPGHVVYVWHAGDQTVVLGGDVLFEGGVGRTDLPGGSFQQLRRSIHEQLFTLPDATVVLPGHGPPTAVGREKRLNPFVGLAAGLR